MSAVAEFTLSAEGFALGQALQTADGMKIRLEEAVPVEGLHIPYFWATGGDFEAFERSVRDDPHVEAITRLDRIDGEVLYRITWTKTDHGPLAGIREAGGVIMEAFGDGDWHFRLRFQDHDALEAFYQYCTEHGITLDLDRVHTLTDASNEGRAFELTPEQRETLVLALRRGYFSSPKETNLEQLADELGITKQAVSQRLRKGNEQVLREALLSTTSEVGG